LVGCGGTSKFEKRSKFMDKDFESLTTKSEVHLILISINIKCGIELCHHLLRII
jgi:hypothetical protein